MKVIGVDFSGDKRDHKTWVAQGEDDYPMVLLEGWLYNLKT